ncbi:hypothetical protein ACKGJY_01695 [Hyunsoonleella sp. 2307UL5-6]|uniref:hypothetical protein n=1 Tax=Hyunsoonleella sp. 2307UL5-6 TaxID=3384768 RepID=UPI0039BCC36B
MKTIVSLFVVIILFMSDVVSAQSETNFGIKGGLNLTFFKVTQNNFGTNPETEASFYGGIFADFSVDEDFSIQPEILYIVLNDFNFINAPIYAKYKVGNNINLLVGPSINYFFDFFTNKLKIRGDIATAYQLNQILDIHIKYTIGFQEITPNGLFIGMGFKL